MSRWDQLLYQLPQPAGRPGRATPCPAQRAAWARCDKAYQAARSRGLNLLAQIKDATGSLDSVRQVVQVRGYVACTEEFTEIPRVINGASDLFLAVFGERGPHARTAIGVQNLPLGFAVEVDMAVQLG